MSDEEFKQKIAKVYLDSYNNYIDLNKQIDRVEKIRDECHKNLCSAAGLFLGLDESEMSRILFYWESIATDAKVVLGIKDE